MANTPYLDWSSFKYTRNNGSIAFNGEMFEDLIREILLCHFDGIWLRTPRTWDGGKDFVDRSILDHTRWAECKMYKEALSLKAISNTLVMALSDQDVRQLLVFSYSALNRQARNHLATFSATTNIQVQSFDGMLLENFVLKTPAALQRFFRLKEFDNELMHKSMHDLENVEIKSFFSANPQIDEQQLDFHDNPTHTFKIPLKSPCVYQLISKSTSTKQDWILEFDLSAIIKSTSSMRILNQERLQLEQDTLRVSLKPGQISGVKLYLSFDRSGKFTIPPIPITIGNKPIIKQLPKKNVSVGFLTRPELIGSRVLNACKQIRNQVSAGHTNLIVAATGISGVGKSRLIDEVQGILLGENFEVRGLDGASANCVGINKFARVLLARLWRLPDPLVPAQPSIEPIETLTGDSIYEQVCDLIYGDLVSDSISDNTVEQIIGLACQALGNRRNALLIDNVQALDSLSIKLLRRISQAVQGQIGSACILFAFNEQELLYSDEALSFRQLLKEQNAHLHDSVHYIELVEFTPDQVRLFLNQIIRLQDSDNDILFSDQYPSLTSLILEHVLPRPLDLFQLLKAAEDKEIVEVHFDCFHIRRLDEFHELVRSLQKSTESILEQRWQYIQSKSTSVGSLLLFSLVGDVPEYLLESAGIDESTKQSLIHSGFIKVRSSGEYHYYHQSIERHFSRKLLLHPTEDIRGAGAKLLERLNKSNASQLPALVQLQLLHLVRKVSSPLIFSAVDQLKGLKDVPVDSRLEISANILEPYLNSRFGFIALADYLPTLSTLCRFMSGRHQEKLSKILIKYSDLLLKHKPKNDEALNQQFWIIRQAGSYAKFSSTASNGVKILEEGLVHLRSMRGILSASSRARITADLYDRVCVHQKTLGFKKDAVRSGNKAVRICKRFSISDVQCLSLIDLGYIYYGSHEEKKQLLYYWKKAVQLFESQYQKVTSKNSGMIYACELIQATIIGLEGENGKALKILDKMIQRAHKNDVPYYEVQGLLVKAIILLRDAYGGEKSKVDKAIYDRIISVVVAAEDLSLTFGMNKFLPDCHFLVALCKTLQGRESEAANRFEKMLSLIVASVLRDEKILGIVDLTMISKANSFLVNETGKAYSLPINIKTAMEGAEDLQKNNSPVTTLGLKELELPCP